MAVSSKYVAVCLVIMFHDKNNVDELKRLNEKISETDIFVDLCSVQLTSLNAATIIDYNVHCLY